MRSPSKFLVPVFNLVLGTVLGLLLLEAVLRFNPPLLSGLRGLGAPAPVDSPLTASAYDVHYSDGDQLFWRPDLVRPVPPGEDRLETRVTLETDEFGFRNPAPLPAEADLVVLGRSFSLGAQTSSPWPSQLAAQTGWAVVNLSQPGSSLDVKLDYLLRYGLPRRPRWVVVEVEPPIDCLNYHPYSAPIIQMLPLPLAQEWIRRFYGMEFFFHRDPIYPLPVDLPGRTLSLTCCVHYLDSLTLTPQDWKQSRGWREFAAGMKKLAQAAERNGARLAVLYVPTKPEVYFPLALDSSQLVPALRDLIPLALTADGELAPDPARPADIDEMRANALAARDALADFARANGLVFIDPTGRMVRAVLDGNDPFMVYDSHWNLLGHELVAQTVAATLASAER
jgi:hypothetical protein